MTARTRWTKNGDCLCTDEELREVLRADRRSDLAVWFMYEGGYLAEGAAEAIADTYLVCLRVLEARHRKNLDMERMALGPEQRWGRRGNGVDAMQYVTRNVARKRDIPFLDGVHVTRRGRARFRDRYPHCMDPLLWIR